MQKKLGRWAMGAIGIFSVPRTPQVPPEQRLKESRNIRASSFISFIRHIHRDFLAHFLLYTLNNVKTIASTQIDFDDCISSHSLFGGGGCDCK